MCGVAEKLIVVSAGMLTVFAISIGVAVLHQAFAQKGSRGSNSSTKTSTALGGFPFAMYVRKRMAINFRRLQVMAPCAKPLTVDVLVDSLVGKID